MAQAWLDAQAVNRPISRALVTSLARSINAGNWMVTHQGLAFDADRKLVDGQHRLHAILTSQKTVPIMCTFGISRDVAIAAVDQGARRTMAQLAGMQGESNAPLKSSICRVLGIAVLGVSPSERTDPMDFRLMLDEYRAEIDIVIEARHVPMFTSPVLGAFALTLRTTYGRDFFDGCMTGANLSDGDPRLALRNALQGGHLQRRRTNYVVDRMLRTISAAHLFGRGNTITSLMISTRRYEEFCADVKIPVSPHVMAYATQVNGK